MNRQITTAPGPRDPDDGDQERQLRGLAIAALANIREDKFGYKVPSQFTTLRGWGLTAETIP